MNRELKLTTMSASLVLIAACSEGRSNPDASIALDMSTVSDGATGDAGPEDGGVIFEGLVINEIRAAGDDWIELKNTSTVSVDLSELSITDSDGPGTPATDHVTTFPSGFVVEPGAYVLVVADLGMAARDGIQTDCLGGGVASCLEASFGISKSSGDEIFLLDSANNVLMSATYPPNATADDQTWARLPDGTGDFAPASPSPFAANEAP